MIKRITSFLLACVLMLSTVETASAFTTTFRSRSLKGWRDAPTAARWVARSGSLRRVYQPVGYAELVRPTAYGIGDDFAVTALIRTSPGRTNAGVTTLFRNHANHMWGKIEITPGYPEGFMSIGHRIRGKTVSLLSRTRVALKRGTPYRLRMTKTGDRLQLTVSTKGGTRMRSIGHTLTRLEKRALRPASKAGLRSKTLFDEDDGRSRWLRFSVSS